jgi:hypothetical protein
MRTSLWLRTAAVITLLYFAAHTMGMPWTPATGPQETIVLDAMKSTRFDALGASRTYWDFYLGFGVVISGYLALQAVALWQLGSLANHDARQLRPIIAAFFVSFSLNAILAWKYFFAIPVVIALVIAGCLALAFVSAQSSRPA